MATITITNYNKTTGCVSFTIDGTPTPAAVTVQTSTNNGVTWGDSTGSIVSPRCGFPYSFGIWIRLRLPDGTYSQIWKEDYQITRTPINNSSKILFTNSPVDFEIQNALLDNTIENVTLKCWVWSGDINRTLGVPNFTLYKAKVSSEDNYIEFQVADYLRTFLNPQFAYNEMNLPAVANQGVFFQYEATIVSAASTTEVLSDTYYATLGYRWNYEQTALGNNGITPNGSIPFSAAATKYYNHLVPNYITQSFDFTKTLLDGTSANIIKTERDTPIESLERCSRDPYVIVYLDKLGFWQMLTPFGKTIVSTKIKTEYSNRAFRKRTSVDNRYQHHKGRTKLEPVQSYRINTGSLTQEMVQMYEELMYSEKIYLIEFKGDLQTTTTIGLTIDNTFVTIDDETITIDSTTITDEYLAFYKTFRQIPVYIPEAEFLRKTILNNKSDINYSIIFEETNNKIL